MGSFRKGHRLTKGHTASQWPVGGGQESSHSSPSEAITRLGMVRSDPEVGLREASVCPLGSGLLRNLSRWTPLTGFDENIGLSGADLQRVLLPGRLGM